MTATTTTTAEPALGRPGPAPLRLMRSELLKIVTTKAWWLLLLGALAMLALAFLVNAIGADFAFGESAPEGIPAEDRAAFEASRNEVYQAANLYTSGQFFGLMFVMLLGIILMTGEFFHQTATATFLATPHRTAVVLAKLAVAALCGAVLWAVTTTLTVPATATFLQRYDVPSHLGDWPVQRAIMLNLLAYGIWGMFGVSLGVLIRSQIGATVTAVALYLIGTAAVQIILAILEQQLGWDWVSNVQYAMPAVASALMVTGTDLPGEPAWWVGGLVLVAYVVVAGGLGILINRRRDVS